MTWDEFKVLAKGMRASYSSQNFLPDNDSLNIWYRLLKDLPYDLVSAAVQKHILTSKFPPTVAEIRESCVDVCSGPQMSWVEGWSLIGKVMSRYGYNRPSEAIQELKRRDERTGRVAELLGWENLCLSENIVADRANFRQCYETMTEREKETAKLPEAFRTMIAGVGERLRLGDGK